MRLSRIAPACSLPAKEFDYAILVLEQTVRLDGSCVAVVAQHHHSFFQDGCDE